MKAWIPFMFYQAIRQILSINIINKKAMLQINTKCHREPDPQEPSTPKKVPIHKEYDLGPKIKFKYTVTEKPHTSKFTYIFFFSAIFLTLMVVYTSYHDKLKNLQQTAAQEWVQCKQDYIKNKCQKGLKQTIKYCEEKRKCFEGKAEDLFEEKVNIVYLLGTIMREFFEGVGLLLTGVLVVVSWLLLRRNSRQVRKEYIQYYNS